MRAVNEGFSSLSAMAFAIFGVIGFLVMVLTGCADYLPSNSESAAANENAEELVAPPAGDAPNDVAEAADLAEWLAKTYPQPSGQFIVGVRDFEFTDRQYPVNRVEDENGRRLMVRMWYPAASTTRRRAYLEGAEEKATVEPLVRAMSQFLPAISQYHELASIVTYSHVDAPPANTSGLPLLIYNHGGMGFVAMNTALMEELASRGYLCLSVAHPGEASGVLYPNGDIAPMDMAFVGEIFGVDSDKTKGSIGERFDKIRQYVDDGGLGPRLPRWRDDLLATVDMIERGNIPGEVGKVLAKADVSKLVYAGVSYGGSAAVSAAQADSRARAAINLDGTHWLSDVLDKHIRVPLLVLTTEVGSYYSNEFFFEPVTSIGEREDIARVRIPNIVHFETFEGMFLPKQVRQAMPGGGRADGRRTHDLMLRFVTDFLDRYLNGAENEFPAAAMAVFPEAEIVDLSGIRRWANSSSR